MAANTTDLLILPVLKRHSFHKIKPKRQCFWCDKVIEADEGEEISLHLICFECKEKFDQEQKENDM
jgi:predicted nucleic acid-binding Zn ribbon protein